MKRILSLISVVSLVLSMVSCAEQPKNDYIGLQLYSIRNICSEDINAALQMTKDAGYAFVETADYNQEAGTFYGMAPADFAALCNKYSLDLLSSHTNGTRPDAETWDYCIEWWKKAIADHKAAGMKYIVQPSLRGNWKTSLEDLDWNCKLFNEVGKMCAAEGIKFGFHNHAGEFTVMHDVNGEQMRVFDYILANTDPQYVFLELDLHWITEGGASAVEYFKANPGRFTLWHVKDKLEVGASGFIDFPAIYENATISGMAYQVIEQEAFTDGYTQFESIKQSCDYVKSMLPK